ncbi:MAG: FAD-binding oxidoreductase [Rhodobacteraceae bacterium]|nr:FAD-binding oxidoreductase [Paracoccaceae bacterium]
MNLLYVNDKSGEYPDSWYTATANSLPPFPKLKGTQKADVCVVGAGFTGLSAALHLAERGYSVAVIEAQRVGWGASGRNGGQIGSGQRKDQDELETMLGADDAAKLWEIAEDGKATIRSLVEKHTIDCDLRDGVAHVEWQAKHVAHSHTYARHLQNRYGYDQIEFLNRDETRALIGTTVYHGGTLDWGAAHVHPLNLALGMAKAAADAGVQIYEQSEVSKIVPGDPVSIVTRHGRIESAFLVLACNGYLGGLDNRVARKVMPINNFVVATEPLEQTMAEALIAKDVAIADSKFVVNYYRRSADHRMLFGGGETYGWRFPSDIRALVSKPMLEVYPQLKDVKLDYAWGGTLAITMNRMPNFARLEPNIYTASGYSGHGVGMATVAGKITAAAIAGQAEQFDAMAKVPVPTFPGGTMLRWPGLVMAMTWYSLRDRFGV